MTDIKITEYRVWTLIGYTSTDQGLGHGKTVQLDIQVALAPAFLDVDESGPIPEPQRRDFDRIELWLNEHIRDRDLARSFDFAPTGRNIAIYLSRVCRGITPDFAGISVTVDGVDTQAVEYV